MQINLKRNNSTICVSDIVGYKDGRMCKERAVCMIIQSDCRYGILNLNTGLVLKSYGSLEEINEDSYNVKLIAKSKNSKLVLLEE